MPRTEVRKECPSCGLSVPLDAKVCEFCLWDFEEEDEWIDQIERLERELIEQNQRFDETAVDRMIKATLHRPSLQKSPGETPANTPPEEPSSEDVSSDEKAVAEESLDELELEFGPSEALSVPDDDLDLDMPEDLREEEAIPPPPPEEHELTEGPKIVKPKPEITTSRPSRTVAPEKKVRRVATRTVSGTKRPPAAASAGKKYVPEGESGVSGPSVRSAQAPDSLGKMEVKTPPQEGEKKGLFSGLTKVFSLSDDSSKQAEEAVASKPSQIVTHPATASSLHEEARTAPGESTRPGLKPGSAPGGTKVARRVQRKVSASARPSKSPEPGSRKPQEEMVRAIVRVFICPLCKKEVPEDSNRCENCGAEFE